MKNLIQFMFLFLMLVWNGMPPFHVWYAATVDQPIQIIATTTTNSYTVTNTAAQGYFTVSTFDSNGVDYFPIWTNNLPLAQSQPPVFTTTTMTAQSIQLPATRSTFTKLVTPRMKP